MESPGPRRTDKTPALQTAGKRYDQRASDRRAGAKLRSVIDAADKHTSIVKSAGRTLAIFEYFDDVQREVRVGEIAAQLRYPQSSVSYLLKSLVKSGYLDYDPVKRAFLPTPRVALLGSWISRPGVGDGTLVRLVRAIANETGLTATLASRNGIYAQYIHVLETESSFPVHIPVGTSRLLVWSAAGFALLSDQPPKTIRALVQRTNAEISQLPEPISFDQVLRNVELFRSQGYFLSDSLVTPGGGHISMRLPGVLTGGRDIVLGTAGSSPVIVRDREAIVQVMRSAIAACETSPEQSRGGKAR
jgi:DNA-binding IclR family transcriptional regulator